MTAETIEVEPTNRGCGSGSAGYGFVKRKGLTIRQQRIEKAVSTILEAIGEDPQREGLQDTPRRVASMYLELFSGIGLDPGGGH